MALVVGGHSGFGLAIAEAFAAEGARLVLAGRRVDVVTAQADRLGGTGLRGDIVDDDSCRELVDTTLDRHGSLDIAVNCAGYEQSTPLRDLTPEKLRAMVDVQFVGAVQILRHACNAMADTGGGAFLSMSSLTAQNPQKGLAAYAGCKAGIEYVTQIAAVEYGPERVRVNCVAAHMIETPMTRHFFELPHVIEALRRETPLGYPGSVRDVATASLFLCSDDARWITGETLRVDGGAFTQRLPTQRDYEAIAALHPELAPPPGSVR